MPFSVHSHDDEWPDVEPFDDPISNLSDADIDEALLSDDLLEFAQQLSDDAAHLQACYPAERPSKIESAINEKPSEATKSPPKKKFRWAALAFGAGTACLLIAVSVIYYGAAPQRPDSPIANSDHAVEAGDSLAVHQVGVERYQTSTAAFEASISPQPIHENTPPTITEIGNATGPQLEALYDYLEDEDKVVRLSI